MGEPREGEVCVDATSVSFMEYKNSLGNDSLKRDHQCIADEAEPDSPPIKKHVKEASNEEVLSEVSNPTVVLKETALAFQDITSQPAEATTDGPRCSEDTSKLSGNLSIEESSSGEKSSGNDESSGGNGTPASVTRSCVVLEIPEHACTTGIRKIKFSFSKRNESVVDNDVDSVSGYGTSEDQELDISEDTSPGTDANVYRGHPSIREPYSCAPNMELKMSKKVVPNGYPTNVKMLLSSGILNGARVKYVFSEAQHTLDGIVSGGGYICGCSSCNYTEVVSAYEFEQHAGFKTRHPNNHIYLENGKPIYRIIQEIKTAPVSLLDQVIRDIAGSAINEKLFHVWKDNLQQSSGRCQVAKKQLKNMRHSHASYLEESMSPTPYSPVDNNWSYYAEMLEKRKHPLKKPNSSINKSVKQQKKSAVHKSVKQQKRSAEGGKRRDNDLHKLLFMPNGLPDGAELVYFVKGQRLLEGYKQGSGIFCSCCSKEISPSQFEAHAGMAARRQPYRHIYTSQGLTLHDIAMSLADGQVITTGGSDDMCTVCGQGGNLVLCAGCPRAFHAACLGMHSLPEGDWCCSSCRDKFVPGKKAIVGDLAPARQIVVRLTRVVKAPEFEMGGCAVCRAHDFSISNFDDRTVMLCDQCEKEFHVGCLRDAGLCDLTELPKDKWFCCDDCNKIHTALQRSVSSGLEKVPALYLDAISRKLISKGIRTDEESGDVQWRILSGKSRYQEHLPLLSRATAIFRECFDPIVATSGRDLIPVMVYGRNISGQEFGGMYCIVLTVKSVVVSAGLLRIFGKEVAELPLVATTREHQGKGYFQALFSCIEGLLRSLNVEKMVLPAAEEAESIWTKRFGFRKMSEDQLRMCMRQVSVTMFKGTSMLEREVQQQHHTKD